MGEGGQHHPQGRGLGPVRVVAIEDRPICARGLRLALEEAADQVTLVDVHEDISSLDGRLADVATLELGVRDERRPREAVTALRERGLAVVVYTAVYDVRQLAEAVEAGAAAVVLKHQPEEVLLEAIRLAHAGKTYLPEEVRRHLDDSDVVRPRLSAREVEVLNLLYQGLITKQAARKLMVSESTVKEHLKRIRHKYTALGRPVSTRVQLLQVAHRDGFITADLEGTQSEEAEEEA